VATKKCGVPEMLDFFPLAAKPYPSQEKILEVLKEGLASNKKFLLLRAPTGLGKSAVALTAALFYRSLNKTSHLLVSRRFLQQQYLDEFKRLGLANLWGKSHYPCPRARELGDSLASAVDCLALKEPRPATYIARHCAGGACPYLSAKETAAESAITMNNYESFLAHSQYSGLLKARDLMIIDEAHALEDRLANFASLTIPLRGLLDAEAAAAMPKTSSGAKYLAWLTTSLLRCTENNVKSWAKTAGLRPGDDVWKLAREAEESVGADLDSGGAASAHTRLGRAAKLHKRVSRLARALSDAPRNWVVYHESRRGTAVTHLKFSPVLLGDLANQYVFNFADKVLLMSATLDTGPFLTSLGISPDEVAAVIDVGSVFPIASRPLLATFCGNMSSKYRDTTLPKVAAEVEKLLSVDHATEKGCIHTHSFKNSSELHDRLPSSVRDRVIWHRPGDDLDSLVQRFYASENLWLASPSCTEGLDGKGDRIRAQILIKAPYPSLGDARVAARLALKDGPIWYASKAVSSLVQAYGRGTRGKSDYCVTYVLDTGVSRLALQTRGITPRWFADAWRKSGAGSWENIGGRWIPKVTSRG
jgi:ATP-dependent DNA helicase DinG